MYSVTQAMEITYSTKSGEDYRFALTTTDLGGSYLGIRAYLNGEGTVSGGKVGGDVHSGVAQIQYFVTERCESCALYSFRIPHPQIWILMIGQINYLKLSSFETFWKKLLQGMLLNEICTMGPVWGRVRQRKLTMVNGHPYRWA